MSAYALQKAIREINRDPGARQRFFAAPESALEGEDLTPEELGALVARNYGVLYRLGVHGLILRPFSIINGVAESDYLTAIREEP